MVSQQVTYHLVFAHQLSPTETAESKATTSSMCLNKTLCLQFVLVQNASSEPWYSDMAKFQLAGLLSLKVWVRVERMISVEGPLKHASLPGGRHH